MSRVPFLGAPPPRVLAISPGEAAARNSLVDWLETCAAAAVDAVQLREKYLDDLRLLELVRKARRILPEATLLLVNARVDVAVAAGASGVHLPAAGLPAAAVRERFGDGMVIGCSTHKMEEIELASAAGADYVTYGPIYETPSKSEYGPAQGLERLRKASTLGLPVYALGGVTIDRMRELAEAGAAGVAGIRCFQADRLLQTLETARSLFRGNPRQDTQTG